MARCCSHCGRVMRDREALKWGQCKACLNKNREIVPASKRLSAPPRPRTEGGAAADATMDEIEAIIAEQMRCLPDWWDEKMKHT